MTALKEEYRKEIRDIISQALNDGSDPEGLYLIEHHLFAEDAGKLENMMLEAFRLGYEMDEPEEIEQEDGSQLWCCDLVIESPLKAELLEAQVIQVLKLVEKHHVGYDGWGTWFEDPNDNGEDDPDDEDEDDQYAAPDADNDGRY